MFNNLEKIKDKYEATVADCSLKDFSGNVVMFTYDIDFGSDMRGIVTADYYMLSVETFLKFTTGKTIPVNKVKCVISDLDDLRVEIKNYFEEMRKKTWHLATKRV